jgi:hypothetical protein
MKKTDIALGPDSQIDTAAIAPKSNDHGYAVGKQAREISGKTF